MADSQHRNPTLFDRITTFATFALLLLALGVGLGPNVSTVAVQLGSRIWPGYAAELREDPEEPDCAVEELDARLEQCTDAPAPEPGGDPFGGADPFADDPAPQPEPADPFGGADPFADDPAPKPGPEADPFGGADPFADDPAPEPEPDPFADDPEPRDPFADDPFAEEEPAKPEVNCAALKALREQCAAKHVAYDDIQGRLTGGVRAFRTFESAIGSLAKFPLSKHLLVLLVVLGGVTTTRHRVHIALRDPRSVLEHRISQGAQLVAHAFWLASCLVDTRVQYDAILGSLEASGGSELVAKAAFDDWALLGIPVLWALGFATFAAINLGNLVFPGETEHEGTTPARALMVVPLYAYMAILGAVWFLGAEGHGSGQAIFLHKFIQIPSIYVGIGLYIWAGMLLARTRLAPLVFEVLVPWRLPPAVLAWLVVVLAALPTAYSGASGIFVIAAGAVIFERLRAYGARPRIALAATAMSGSLGVVLRPCLVVVLVAVLNKEVTTDSLFGWGLVVFGLTAVLFLIGILLRNREPFVLPDSSALTDSLRNVVPLLPFAGIALVIWAIYRFPLGTPITEHTAAFVLPGVLLAMLLWDRAQQPESPTWPALSGATSESAHHIGALLFVMMGSVGVGGVVERSEIMVTIGDGLPETDHVALEPLFDALRSLYAVAPQMATMALLVIAMVLVGMTMDALGAVILVSVSLKHVALANGIDPIHFWMMVLCAFELGYLTPPVALNHLLARQVIGDAADMSEVPADGWFHRHEHILLPMAVMGTALILVAFVPFAFY